MPARKNLDADFPLRGTVVCGYRGTPLTACWAKGKYSLYPYYFCSKRGCEGYSQTVRRETIDAQFATILRSMQPSENVKQCRGVRIWESTGTGNLTKAQEHRAKRMSNVREAQLYGVRESHTFRAAASLAVVRRILNLAASEWLNDSRRTWLEPAPKIKLFAVKDARAPYPLTQEEQAALFQELPITSHGWRCSR